jgi:hypothetical protein
MAQDQVFKKLGGGPDMWIAAIILLALTWILISFAIWAVVYGGAMNDADRYEEGNPDGPDTKKSKLSDKGK